MAKAQDLMSLQISLEFNAIKEDGSAHNEEYIECFSLEQADVDEVVMLLRDLADAIENGRAYGWLSDQIMDATVGSGDFRPETTDEHLARTSKEWGNSRDEETSPEITSSSVR